MREPSKRCFTKNVARGLKSLGITALRVNSFELTPPTIDNLFNHSCKKQLAFVSHFKENLLQMQTGSKDSNNIACMLKEVRYNVTYVSFDGVSVKRLH